MVKVFVQNLFRKREEVKKKTNGMCKTLMSSQGKECKSNKRREAKSKPKGNQAMRF
jgi:hypothetical protein